MRPIFLILIFSIGSILFAQEESAKKNALYLSGDWMTKNLSASLNYERLLLITDNGKYHLASSLAYGRWYTVDSKGSNYSMNLHFLAGENNTQAELSLGIRCMDNEGHYFYPEPPEESLEQEQNQLSFFPDISIGFRYQKPGGRLLFRSAIGIPFLQISLGYCF